MFSGFLDLDNPTKTETIKLLIFNKHKLSYTL